MLLLIIISYIFFSSFDTAIIAAKNGILLVTTHFGNSPFSYFQAVASCIVE